MASFISQILITFLILRLQVAFTQDYTYLGCFFDNNRKEILPDLIYCDRSVYPYQLCQNTCGPQSLQYCQSEDMTTELCGAICADQNMRFFGLQAGSQCQCGGYFAPYDRLGHAGQPIGLNDTCNRPCTGNSTQMCGADFQSNIYQINEPGSDCFNPGYVLNGDQSQQDHTFYNAGDIIDYAPVCPPPSIKNGAASITCMASGNWTDPPPTCTVRCATPTAPPHSHFSAGQTLNNSYAVDDEVLYDCDNDPTRANLTLTCGYYGDRSSTFSACAVTMDTDSTTTTSTQPTTTPQLTTLSSTTAGGNVIGTTFQAITASNDIDKAFDRIQYDTPLKDGSISPCWSITGNPSTSPSSDPLGGWGYFHSPEATATMM